MGAEEATPVKGAERDGAAAAQLALAASEERLRLALLTAGMGVIDIRRPSRAGFYSDEYLRLYGYGPEQREHFAAGWEPLVHPEDAPALIAHRRHVWSSDDEVLEMRTRRMHRSGHWIWVRSVGRAFEPDENGYPTRWLSIVADIDRAQRNELELKENEARLRMAQAIARLGDWRVDGRTRHHRWSDEAWRLLGLEPGACEASLQTFLVHVHPEDAPRIGALAKRLDREFFDVDEDLRIVRPDGAERHVHLRVRVAKAANGQDAGLIGTVQDITESKSAELKLRDAGADLALAQRIARLGSWRSQQASDTQELSAGMFEILGIDPASGQVPFSDLQPLMTPDSWQRLRAARGQALAHGTPYEIELEGRRVDGSPLWAMVRSEVERDAQGRIVGTFGTVQDITAHKLAEIGLREARDQLRSLSSHHEDVLNAQRRRIALDVHDELGQMLTAMKFQLDLLQPQLAGHAAATATAEQLRQLVDATIEVTRNVALSLHPPALDLGLVPALEWLAEDFSLRSDIPCAVEAGSGEVEVDKKAATELFRIAQESLTNVARHAQAQQVRLTVEQSAGGICMSVCDDGCGFDPAAAQGKGHFGLLGMRERAWRLGAELEVQSAPGAGTTVRVALRDGATSNQAGPA